MDWINLIRHAADSALRSIMGMRPHFMVRREADSVAVNSLKPNRPSSVTKPLPALVKSRPPQFEERYAVMQNSTATDQVFLSLRATLFEACDALSTKARRNEGGKIIFREQGKTSEGRPFMFFKPYSDYGWLIERSGAGWRVSRAEKIVRQQMFLRGNGDPWDVVLVYEDPKGEGAVRVKSQRFGNTLMALPVYEARMRESFTAEIVGRVH